MRISQKAIDLIKRFESLHDDDLSMIGLQPKMCPAGIWTCGYGHAMRWDDGTFIKGAQFKTAAYARAKLLCNDEQQAETLLAKDLSEFAAGVQRWVNVALNDDQFGALVSFAYNVGVGNLQKSTLLKYVNAGDFARAAGEFEKWNKAGGKVLRGLTLRREAERGLFVGKG